MFTTDALIGYVIVFAFIGSAYLGSLKKQNNIRKKCTDFYDCYQRLVDACYPVLTQQTLLSGENGLLPLEEQPKDLQDIISTAQKGNVSSHYRQLKGHYDQVNIAIGKSVKNDKNFLYPLLQVLEATAAFSDGCTEYSMLENEDVLQGFHTFLTKQDKIHHILSQRTVKK